MKWFSPTFRMSSRQVTSGLRPPCTHRNCWLRRAARGRQSNASIQASYTRSEYFILPAGHTHRSDHWTCWTHSTTPSHACSLSMAVMFKDKQSKGALKPEQQDLHSCLKVKYSVRCRHSWLPLRRKRVLGWLIFRAHRYSTHCRETHSESSHQHSSIYQ